MDQPLYCCMTKATRATGDQLQYGPNWIFSRRAILKLFPDRLECGNWCIAYSDFDEAVLYSVRSGLLRIPCYVLRLETSDGTYHFGLNPGKFWKGDLRFPVRREVGRMSYSWTSLATRLVLAGLLIYLLWQQFAQ